jgi:hypothetical protein
LVASDREGAATNRRAHRGTSGSPVLISLMVATVAGSAGVYYRRMAANQYSIR